MSCLGRADLARIATTGDEPSHVATCIVCRRELERQRALHATLRALPAPEASIEARRAIKAETMASVALEPVAPRSSRHGAFALTTAGVLATAISIVVVSKRPNDAAPAMVVIASRESPAPLVRITAKESAAPLRAAPAITARAGTMFSQTSGADRDVIVLQDGALDVDARSARDVDVHVGPATVQIANASVRVQARQYTIVSVEVVVGAAHVIGPNQQVTLARGAVWTEHSAPSIGGLSSFRDAWIALRAGDNRTAISLFDRATDPAVAEEAHYWAAVAANRAGDNAESRRRFAEFVERFPASPYVEQARQALGER
jgi:hypothetical protein